LFEKALGNIEDVLDYETTQNSQPHLLKLKYDASVFVAQTVGSAIFTKEASGFKPASEGLSDALELTSEQQMRIARDLIEYTEPAVKKEIALMEEEKAAEASSSSEEIVLEGAII
jgi:hypothetical protein